MKKPFVALVFVFAAGVALAGRFQHPGIGLNREQLDQLRENVQGGVEPWKSLYDDLTKHDHRFSKRPRDRKSTRLNSSHIQASRMPASA